MEGDEIHPINCSGVREVFEVSTGVDLTEIEFNTRFEMEYDGSETFIQCTSLFFNRRQLRGSLFVYERKNQNVGDLELWSHSTIT